MKKILLFLSFLLMSIGMFGATSITLASGTFNGKNGKYTDGWTTTGTGKSITDCIIIGNGENITSPTIDLSNYDSIKISIKSRRYGTLSGSQATINVKFSGVDVGSTNATTTTATYQLDTIKYTITSETSKSSNFVFICSNATSIGSTHGAGINSITIIGYEKKLTPTTYTVTFLNSDTLYEQRPNVKEDSIITDFQTNIEPSEDCKKNWWSFIGWTKNSIDTLQSLKVEKNDTLYALYRIYDIGTGYVTDTLTYDKIGLGHEGSNETYTDFIGYSDNSDAMYNGQINRFRNNQPDSSFIQIRSKPDGSSKYAGIVTIVSGGIIDSIRVVWHESTQNGRVLQVHPSDTPYHEPSNLWNDGVKLNYVTITKGISTSVKLDDAKYVGLRSKDGAMYFDSIFITWKILGSKPLYSTNPKCFDTNISVAEWFKDSVKFDIGNYDSIHTYSGPINSCDSIRIKLVNRTEEECIRWFHVPIFAGSHTSKNDCNCDVVILGDSVLTVTDNIENANVTIYPGGILEIGTPSGNVHKTYTMKSLTLRRDNDSIPQLLLHNDGFLDVKTKMFFEMRTDGEDYRWLTLPDTFRTSVVNEPEEVVVKYYDGDYRAKNGRGGWKEEWDGSKHYTKKFAPGEGCIFGIISDKKRIYKIELDTNILSKEKEKKYIRVHPFYHSDKPANDLGWNLVGNPFMTSYNVSKGFGAVFNITDSLVQELDDYGNWTGRWVTEYKHLRYIVIPSDKQEEHIIDAGGYEQICLEDGYKLKPFTSFFIQAKQGADTLVFYYGQRVVNAPAKRQQTKTNETFLRVNVGNIKTGCYISNKFTDDYEIGDDMESLYHTYQLINGYKLLYSAINDSIINYGVHVYTHGGVLSLDEKTDVNEFEEINALYNENWYDLLHGETVDVSSEFILQARRKQHNVATGTDETTVGCDIQKFIYDGKIFIKKNNCIFTVLGEIVK